MNPDLFYQWKEEVGKHFRELGKWQAMGLSLLSFGVILARHASLSRIAEELAWMGHIESLSKRFKRWISNPKLDMVLACELWMKWVWQQYDAQRPILLVDETKLGDRIGIMMVSLAFEQRAIPLVWRCYRANSASDYPQQGQVVLVWQLIARALAVIPLACRPIIQMDRGMAQSEAMFRALKNLQVSYLVRLKGYTRFTSRRGHSQLLRNMVKPGECLRCHGKIFKQEKQVTTHLVLAWEIGQDEPWFLATNDPALSQCLYARRMWQEESFRDLKSGGWQWEASRIRHPERMERYLLVLALAYAWMLTLGSVILSSPTPVFSHDCLNRYSVFRLGLRRFKQLFCRSTEFLVVGLFFAPRPQLLWT